MSLKRLAHLIAAEEDRHELITQIAADLELLSLVRSLGTPAKGGGLKGEEELVQACQANRIPIDYFWDRISLVSRILNLAPAQDDCYQVLEISRDATQEDIKHAFRRLSLANHPDVNRRDPRAAEHFQRIHQAYETLSDTRLKEHYDRSFAKPDWVEPTPSERDFSMTRKKRRRIMILPFALLISVFLALVFLVDYQGWLTERYYRGHGQPAAEKSSQVKKAAQIDQNSVAAEAAALSAAPLACLNRQGGDCLYLIASKAAAKDGGLLTNPMPRFQAASPSPKELKEDDREGAELALIPRSAPETKVRLAKKANEPSPAAQKKARPKLASAVDKDNSLKPKAPERQPSPAPDFKSEAEPTKVLLNDKVQSFLSRYRQAYEDKNLPLFLSFFESNAVENGEPVSNLKATYGKTFGNSDWIKFEFNSRRWTETDKGVNVSSRFRLVLKPKGGRPVTSTGTIRLSLVNHDDTFRVRALDYSFNSLNRE